MVEKLVNCQFENRDFGWVGVVVYVNVKAFNLGHSTAAFSDFLWLNIEFKIKVYDHYKYFKRCFTFCYRNNAES